MKTLRPKLNRAIEFAIVLLALPCMAHADDAPYTAKGHAVYRSLSAGKQFSNDYAFTLSVSNMSWAMEFDGGPSSMRQRQICDGSNLVTMTYFNADWVRNSRNVQDGVVTVDRRRLPVTEPFVAHAVFVAFAAQLYLPPGTNGLLCPLWHPLRDVSGVAFVRSDWDLLTPGGPLAENIRCWEEAEKWNEVLHKEAAQGSANKETGKLLLATYQSFGRTNLAGRVFPTACIFTAFAPDRADGGDKASPVYDIVVTNIVLNAGVDAALFDPRFKGVAVVDDHRSGQRLSRTIFVTNAAPLGLP